MMNSIRSNVDINRSVHVINDCIGAQRCQDNDSKTQLPYDPFQMRDKSNTTTCVWTIIVICFYSTQYLSLSFSRATGALFHLMKSSLGTGILAMPNAFKNGGLIFGLFGTLAIGALCTHCIYLLVR